MTSAARKQSAAKALKTPRAKSPTSDSRRGAKPKRTSRPKAEQMVSSLPLKRLLALEAYQNHLTSELQRLNEELAGERDTASLLQGREAALQATASRLTHELSASREALVKAEAHVDLQSARVAEAESEMGALRSAASLHESAMATHRETAAQREAQLSEELDALRTAFGETVAQKEAELRGAFAEREASLATLREAATAREAGLADELTTLRARLDETTTERDVATAREAQLAGELTTLRARSDETFAQKDAALRAAAEREAQLAGELETLRGRLDAAVRRTDLAESTLSDVQRNYANSQIALDVERERTEAAVARNAKQNATLDEMTETLGTGRRDLASVQTKLSSSLQKIAQLEDELVDTLNKFEREYVRLDLFEQASRQSQALSEQIRGLDAEIARLGLEIEAQSGSSAAIKVSGEHAEAQLSEAMAKCEALVLEIAQARSSSGQPSNVMMKLTDVDLKQLRNPVYTALRGYKMWRRRKTVAASGLFDRNWYLAQYADVAASGVDPLTHFVQFGSFELRSPGPLFDCIAYVDGNSDVKGAGVEPLFHYLTRGRFEKRLAWRFGRDQFSLTTEA
jgi:chromosome segregation ATPase